MMRKSEAFVVNPHPKPKSIFARWCKATTYHGINELYCVKSYLGKVFWFVVVSLGLFFTINQITQLLLDFVLEDKWMTSVYPECFSEGTLEWPRLRICGRDYYSASKLKKANLVDPYDIAFFMRGENGVVFQDKSQANFSRYNNVTELENKINELEQKFGSDNIAHAKINSQSLSLTCEDMMIYCDDNMRFIYDRKFCNCSKFEITPPTSSYAVSCFHINASAIASQSDSMESKKGYDAALQFMIDPNINDYYSNLIYGDIGDGGISFRLYFGNFNNDVAKFSLPSFLSPGSHVVVTMSIQKRRTYLRERRGVSFFQSKLPCMKEPKYRWLRSTVSLRALCTLDCNIYLYLNMCDCIPDWLVSDTETDAPTCDEYQIAVCNNVNNRCVDECKNPCEYDTIATKISASQFPASSKVAAVRNYLNLESARIGDGKVYSDDVVRQLILLDLHYDLEYQKIERVNRVSIDELISNIGGALGAWTGISFITIIQAFVYFGYGTIVLMRRLGDQLVGRPIVPEA